MDETALRQAFRQFVAAYGSIVCVAVALGVALILGWLGPDQSSWSIDDYTSPGVFRGAYLMILACPFAAAVPIAIFSRRMYLSQRAHVAVTLVPVILGGAFFVFVVWIAGSVRGGAALVAVRQFSERSSTVVVNPVMALALALTPVLISLVSLPRLVAGYRSAKTKIADAGGATDALDIVGAHKVDSMRASVTTLSVLLLAYSSFLVVAAVVAFVVFARGNGNPNPGVPDPIYVLLLGGLLLIGLFGLVTRRLILRGSDAARRMGLWVWGTYFALGLLNVGLSRRWCPLIWSVIAKGDCASPTFFVWFFIVAIIPSGAVLALLAMDQTKRFVEAGGRRAIVASA